MRLPCRLTKRWRWRPSVVPVPGADHDIGSLVAGKLADLIAVDLSDPYLQPVYDPASHLVYSNHGRAVSHSWIHGVPQLQDGRLTRIDVPDLVLRVNEWRKQILS